MNNSTLNPVQSPIVLKSSRLVVEIAAPGSIYRETRFDWTGFINQVTLDGAHTFCVDESLKPGQGTKGIGLCNEFGIELPIGYTDAGVGDSFPKLGVGLLIRPDNTDYNFGRIYEIDRLFPIQIETKPDQIKFIVQPLECRGYAAQITKTISVKDNFLEIAYQLENVGSKPIVTHEYCHNFVGIDRQLLGPDYRLSLPYTITLAESPRSIPEKNLITIDQGEIRFRATPREAFYLRPLGFSRSEHSQWELVHLTRGAGVREYDDFAPCRVAIWGTSHVISTEIFVDINQKPGGTQHWSRRYEFYKI